ncbi:ABC transporter permease [Rhodovibrionaceae bacterium A322]
MFAYTARRLLAMIPTLLVISFIIFVIIQLPPGDFLETMVAELQSQGEAVSPDKIKFLREQYGLDKSYMERYFEWVWGLLNGDMGFSFEHRLPVNELIGDRLELTVVVALTTIIFVYLVSFPIGIYSAVNQYSKGDYFWSFIGFLGMATPDFLLALVVMAYFNDWFGISIGGLMDPQFEGAAWTWAKVQSVIAHLWAPIIVIGTSGTASMIRKLRANLLDELDKQYVVTARAKGLSERRLLFKYPLRLAMNPFVAELGSLLPRIISGAAIIAVVMDLPTTGKLLVDALLSQDMYLAGSFLMFQSLLVVIGFLISDLLLGVLDPRIRLTGGATK